MFFQLSDGSLVNLNQIISIHPARNENPPYIQTNLQVIILGQSDYNRLLIELKIDGKVWNG